MPATVVTEPASPISVRAWRTGTAPVTASRAASISAVAAASSAPDGGSPCRCRSVIRTQPISTEIACTAGSPASRRPAAVAWPSTNSVEPPPMSTTRKGPRKWAGPGAAASSAVAPVNDSAASCGSGQHLGRDPEYLLDLAGELRRVARVPGGAGGHHAHRAGRRVRDDVRVVAQHTGGPGERLGRQPPGLVDPLAQPDDLHPARHVGELGPVKVDVRDQQPQRVRAAVHGGHPAGHEDGSGTHGPACHHGPTASSASRPNGFTSPTASSWATRACRHFTRSGMPPAD